MNEAGRADGVSFAHLLLWLHIPRDSIIMKFSPGLEVLCSKVSLLNLDWSPTHTPYPRSARTLRLWNFTCQLSGKETYGFLWICHLPSKVTFSYECLCSASSGGKAGLKIIFVPLENTVPLQCWRASLQFKYSTTISSNIFHLFHEALHAEFDSNLNQPKITYVNINLGANKLWNVCFVSLFSVLKNNFIIFSLPVINSDFCKVLYLSKTWILFCQNSKDLQPCQKAFAAKQRYATN